MKKNRQLFFLYLMATYEGKVMYVGIDFAQLEVSKALVDPNVRKDFYDVESYGSLDELRDCIVTSIEISDTAKEITAEEFRFALRRAFAQRR